MFKTYYNLTKPGIIRGNVINTAAGFLLASAWDFKVSVLIAALTGTALVIASGCVFNNYIDRGIDAKMYRTKNRALASGEISIARALAFGAVLGLLGFWILANYTNTLTVYVGLFAAVMYVVIYGFAKRKSVHGTLVGSISGATPPVAGYVAATNQLDMGALLLFLILVCWQMPHFYAIAIYRLKDYKAAGIPVLPLKYGMTAAKKQSVAYTFLFIMACISLTVAGYAGWVFAAVMTVTGVWWLSKELSGFKAKDDAAWARKMFGASLRVIMTLAVMLSVGSILP